MEGKNRLQTENLEMKEPFPQDSLHKDINLR